jgi:hypothetical protein
MQGCIALTKVAGAPFVNSVQKRGAEETSGVRVSFLFGYFSLDKHKFVWKEFEQPKAGPKGENQGWFS